MVLERRPEKPELQTTLFAAVHVRLGCTLRAGVRSGHLVVNVGDGGDGGRRRVEAELDDHVGKRVGDGDN